MTVSLVLSTLWRRTDLGMLVVPFLQPFRYIHRYLTPPHFCFCLKCHFLPWDSMRIWWQRQVRERTLRRSRRRGPSAKSSSGSVGLSPWTWCAGTRRDPFRSTKSLAQGQSLMTSFSYIIIHSPLTGKLAYSASYHLLNPITKLLTPQV